MDLDQYLEVKAQEEAEKQEGTQNAQAQYTTASSLEEFMEATGAYTKAPATPEQQVETQEVVDEHQATDPQPPQQTPDKVVIEGVEYDVNHLIKQAQEAEVLRANAERLYKENQGNQTAVQYYQKMMEDPEYAKAFAQDRGLPFVDPQQQAVQELEQNYRNLLLERDIESLKSQHSDFDPQVVVQFALERQIPNLRDAYLLHKATTGQQASPQAMDEGALREQIKQEILAELTASQTDTGSLIGAQGGGAKPVQNQGPQLSALEIKIAREFGLSPEEYAKYK